MTRYRSEIGWPFALVYAVLVWRLGWPLVAAVANRRAVAPGLIVAAVMVLGGLAFLAATTSYTINADSLVVRCGPFRTTIALSAIYKLRATSSVLASPALSFNRIEVLASPGPYVLISPANQAMFLRDLTARAPHIQLENLAAEPAG